MNGPAAAASSIGGSTHFNMVDGMQTLRSELVLTRASQLTLLRLQLALHTSNRRAAMQALDDMLDIDAEMASLAATLSGIAAHSPAGDTALVDIDAALSRFIALQKEAIASEKHALAGSDLRSDARSIAISTAGDGAVRADLPTHPLHPEGEAENDDRTGRQRRTYVLSAAIVVIVVGCGMLAYLWPALFGTVTSL